jgi:hypothetical protein
MAGYHRRMHNPDGLSYRALETLCRQQATITSTPETKRELERMAREYAALAQFQERNRSEETPPGK